MRKQTRWKTYLLMGFIFLALTPKLSAQHLEQHLSPATADTIVGGPPNAQGGLSSLRELFGLGTISGHFRNFFMTTINQGNLKNYYADAIGGAIRVRTHTFYGFELGVAGIFTFKAFSNDLNEPDPTTGRISKWEHELFDVLDLENFNDLDRLEELYIRYYFNRGNITYGKITTEETPLLNRSDGRMKPFAFKGLWFNYTPVNNHYFHLSWIDRVSPRSTVEWFDFKEAIGLAPQGFQPDGTPAQYFEHLESEGLAMLGYQWFSEDIYLELYQWYLHNVFYTTWATLEYHKKDWTFGLQYSVQFADGFQRELDYEKRYIQPGERGQVLSGRVRYHFGDWDMWGAYTHAFDTGRFLWPRELGRDHFYTSIPRSRLDGFGNTDIITLGAQVHFGGNHFTSSLEYTRLFGPEVDAFEFNKYNLDAYQQMNLKLDYAFTGFLEGMHMLVMYVYRNNLNNSEPDVIFNRSNYHQVNFVTNFEF